MLAAGLLPPTPERQEEEEEETLRPFPVFEPGEIERRPPAYPDTETHTEFVNILNALPVLTDKRASDVEDPRHILSTLIGTVTQEFLDGIGEVRADGYGFDTDTDWSEVIYRACQVLSTNPRHFFNKLETPEEYDSVPCSRDFKSELEYLKQCDVRVARPIDIISPLFNAAGSYVLRLRAEWSAALIKIINLIADIFRPAMRTAIGNKADVQARFKKCIKEVFTYSNPRETVARFVVGDVFSIDMVIYETLVHLAMPEIHMSHLTSTLNLLWLAEYHSVRCAYDASSTSTLYICLMTPSYLMDVWMPYMRMYFPRIFVFDETSSDEVKTYYENNSLPPWKHLSLYLPDKRQNTEQDPEEFIPFLQEFFMTVLTPEFRSMFHSVSTPRDYLLLSTSPGEVFTVHKDDSIAYRRSKRACAQKANFNLKRTRTK